MYFFQVDLVRSITEKKSSLSAGVKKILETISTYDNIPRKKAKFMNFMTNSFRYMKHNELDEAWTLLEEAMKDSKAEHQQQNGNAVNGNAKQTNGEAQQTNGKRKLIEETDEVEESEPVTKKKKKEVNGSAENGDDTQAADSTEKFNWKETIRSILSAKNNELKLKKLKKKVENKYKSLTGSEWSDKVENKFNKKINKLKGVVVDNEKVRLIE